MSLYCIGGMYQELLRTCCPPRFILGFDYVDVLILRRLHLMFLMSRPSAPTPIPIPIPMLPMLVLLVLVPPPRSSLGYPEMPIPFPDALWLGQPLTVNKTSH